MPAIGDTPSGTRKIKKVPTSPDVADLNREARRQQAPRSPDRADAYRSPAQKRRDAVAVARSVRVSREKYITKRDQAAVRAVVTGRGGKTVDASAQFRAGQQKAREQRTERLAPALTILENLSRLSHAEAAATRAAIKGDDISDAAVRGLKLKDKSTFSDVLGDLGVKNKIVKGIGGFTLDVAADPTTYVTFGVSSVGRKSAEVAARKATEAALKAGASKKAADRAGRAAAKKVLESGKTNRGVTVGAFGKSTSGRATAAASRALRIPQGSEKLRGSLPGRLVRHVAPSVRPAGVAEKDFLTVRDAMRRGRAISTRGEQIVRNRAQAIARVLPGDRHERVIDALEAMGQAPSVKAALSIPVVHTTTTERALTEAEQKSLARQQRAGAARPPKRVQVDLNDDPFTRPVERTSGTPNAEAHDTQWFHGTRTKFEGVPSAKGRWADLGTYLTSDPYYARIYAGQAAGESRAGIGHVVPVRVNPKRVLDWRAGRESAAELKAVVDAMIAKDRAIPGTPDASLARWSRILASGKRLTPESSGALQDTLESASEEIGRLTGRAGTGNRHQVLAETLRELGYDAIRKVDAHADALVVLDESIMRRVTGREGAPATQRRTTRTESAIEIPAERGPHPAESLLEGLSPNEIKVINALRHDYDAMHRAEHAAGLVGPKFREFGYHPRRPISELEPTGSRKRRARSNALLESSKARTNRRRYAEFRGTEDDIYTQNAALAYYLRGRSSAIKLGNKEVIDALHSVGQRWHGPGQKLKDGEEIYKFPPGRMPTVVEGDELKSLMRGGAPPGLNEYRVLHQDLVRTAEQGVPERLEGLEELGRIWDRQLQGRVKTILTVVNPQYHFTNLYGDLFNAYKAAPVVSLAKNLGISAAALAYRARREAASKTLAKQIDPSGIGVKVAGGHKIGLDELVKEAEDHGAINQGFIGRDLAEVLDRQGKEAAQRLGQGRIAKHTRLGRRVATSRVGSRVTHPINTIRDISQYREDAVRLALYIHRRKKGDTPDEAARFTSRHLLDYGDLTQLERSVLRRVLPFYTFTARNTPQQIRALIERPGKYATIEKVREEAQKASDLPEGYEHDLEKYEQQGVPIPIPGTSKLLYPKLPVTDLGRLTIKDQGNYLMAMVTPLIKSPIELDQNYSFFLRRKIDELVGEKGPQGQSVEQLKPAPPVILEALKKMPGPVRKKMTEALHLTPYTDKRTGKHVVGWPAKVDYVWRSTPATTFAGQAGQQIPNTRGQTPGQATFGYLTGLKVVPFSPPEAAKKNAGEMYGYLQAKAKSMRDRGTAYDKSGNRTAAYQKVLDASREAYKVIDPSQPKPRSSFLSPEAQKALQGVTGGGGGLSPEAQAALKSLR